MRAITLQCWNQDLLRAREEENILIKYSMASLLHFNYRRLYTLLPQKLYQKTEGCAVQTLRQLYSLNQRATRKHTNTKADQTINCYSGTLQIK
uniref:Uncharacterized protein n=1 Tax=Physcomitrium patens TaxID=3218 RepID=A0A2K1JHI4_PHYPA|nr:hypothetical protein PHYPA_018417 [Physcomitrium patens]